MRQFAWFALLAVGCYDPCFGHGGTCIGLTVTGNLGPIDQLGITVTAAEQKTPPLPQEHSLPVTTALYLKDDVTGMVDVKVTAYHSGSPVGQGHSVVPVTPGQHIPVTIAVVGAIPADGGALDSGALDAGVDASLPTNRYVFLTGPFKGGGVPGLIALAVRCTSEGQTLRKSGTFKSLLGRTNSGNQTVAQEGRTIVLPSGSLVATDSTFFSDNHQSAINQTADKNPVTACVWTNFKTNGEVTPATPSCLNWMSSDSNVQGSAGSGTAKDSTWAVGGQPFCSNQCYVLCIEN